MDDPRRARGSARCRGSAWYQGGAAERGSVTAEFAVALPAVVLVLVAVLLVAMAGTAQLQTTDAARAGARAAAAGETDEQVAEIARHVGGADLAVTILRAEPWVTVRVQRPVSGGWFTGGLTATGEATAWLERSISPPFSSLSSPSSSSPPGGAR